jgi:hypothetical protein
MIWLTLGAMILGAVLVLVFILRKVPEERRALIGILSRYAGYLLGTTALALTATGRFGLALPFGVLAFYLLGGQERIFPWLRKRQNYGRPSGTHPGSRHTMSRDEAYRVLNLKPGASKQDIRRAYRELMKRLHPDMGGSDHFAAQLNEAKDILLGDNG